MTDLIEVKTADLSGEALGWAVGKAEGLNLELVPPQYGNPWRVFARYQGQAIEHTKRFNPWENWALGGQLIDKHHGSTQYCPGLSEEVQYSGGPGLAGVWCCGPTALVAFSRGFVHYKLGHTVQVPKELMS